MEDVQENTANGQVADQGITHKTINIREVFSSKSPGLARLIPGFVYRYLRRIVHEDEINRFLYENRDKYNLDFVAAVVRFFDLKITVHGIENIPSTGRCTVVSNHPLGGLDGIALMHVIGQVRQDVITTVNDLLMFLPNVRNMFIPVNKHGKNTDNVALINAAFAADNIMMHFPAGLCSRKHGGVVRDVEWKSTFVTRAKRYERIVIPVHFSGHNSGFFYNLALLRKFLRIKANIEMFYLVNEMFKQKNRDMVITIGDPLPPSVFDKRMKPNEWAAWVKEMVYSLPGGR